MKSTLVVDCEVNAVTLPEYLRPTMKWKRRSKDAKPEAYLPAGTMFDGPQALFLCRTGQAAAADQECVEALGMTPAEAAVAQRKHLAAAAGIKGQNDHELFMAGVIDGYGPGTTDTKPVYKPGKNWAAYAEALGETKEGDDLE